MNENIADEIRKTIESIKDMKIQASGINNYLSILEGMMRADIQKKVDEAYQRGLEDGKKAFDLLDAERDSEYQRGLDDGWEAARKLFSSMADSDIEKAFPIEWNNGGFNALMNLQPQVAIEKLKAYEEKQKAEDDIKLGDEVVWADSKCVVIFINRDIETSLIEDYDLLANDGSVAENISSDRFRKTGKHYGIEKILEEMRT